MAEINLKKAILQYSSPTIVLDELSIINTNRDDGDPRENDEKANNIQKKYFGYQEPLIKINTNTIKGLRYFSLDLTDFKPSIVFRFSTNDEKFIFTSFPKDGDIVSVYIRALGELFKPIRMDFIITQVVSPFSSTSSTLGNDKGKDQQTGKYQTYTIFAEVKIPKIYKHISKNFKGTSYQALQQIAGELSLGFASNVTKTKDEMNWLCPNLDYETFIKNVTRASWNGEEDYFDCWIDQYYNINFVNLKKQFDNTNNKTETLRMPYGVNETPDMLGGQEIKEIEFPLMITNSTRFATSPLYIRSFSLENNAGRINNDLGYFQKIQFYDDKLVSDKPKNKFVQYDIETITNKDIGKRSTLYKGRIGENIYKEEIKKTYVGTTYFDNVHENYHQAQVQNIINKNDNYKILLKVKNSKWTPFLYRGQNFPVVIEQISSSSVAADTRDDLDTSFSKTNSNEGDKRVINAFLSGDYVVLGFNVEYTVKDGMYQTMVLGKKEWTMNPGIASEAQTSWGKNDNSDASDLSQNNKDFNAPV
jgi:hypothetical protein